MASPPIFRLTNFIFSPAACAGMEIIKVEMKHKVNAHEREKKNFAIEYYLFKKNKLFFIKKKTSCFLLK
ncbi:hypothetical protein LguiB_021301 [Lonicera macranthoides]